MESRKPGLLKIVRACIIAAAVALMLTSAFLHSSIISPSIYHDGTVLVPQRASISLNGTVIADEGELPMMVTLSKGDVLRLEGTVDSSLLEHRRAYLIATDAPLFRIYINGELIATGGSASSGSTFFGDYHSSELVHVGRLPDGTVVHDIAVEFENPSRGVPTPVTINGLIAGSSFDIISLMKNEGMICLFIMVAFFTLEFLTIMVIILMHRQYSTAHVALILALELLLMLQSLVNSPVRMLLVQNEQLWQVLDQLTSAFWPLTLYALLCKSTGNSGLEKTRYRVLALLPLFVVMISLAASGLLPHFMHTVFHLTKPLSLAVTFVYIITMLIEKRTSESGSVTWYHLTSPLLVALAMALELSSVPELRFYTVLRLAGGMLRLIATINYIIFAISEYLSRERIIIGQIELDDLLYKDSLTGCLNRRNLDRFRSDPESLADSFYIVEMDINDLKLVNDCFGHREGDKVFSYFGSFIRLELPAESRTFRQGGDEFVSIIPPESVNGDMEAFLSSFAARYSEKAPYSTSISYGWTLYEGSGKADFERLLAQADRAMYRMKKEIKSGTARLVRRSE